MAFLPWFGWLTLPEVVIALISLSILVYICMTWNYDLWEKQGAPGLKPAFPLGTAQDFLLSRKCIGEMYKDQYDQFPNERFVCGFRITTPYLVVRDPELVKAVMVRDFDAFHDRPLPVDEETMPLSVNLVCLRGRRWRALRAKLRPAFTPARVAQFFGKMAACSADVARHLAPIAEKGTEIELYSLMASYTVEVISSCVLGLQANCVGDPEHELIRVGMKFARPSLWRWFQRVLIVSFPAVQRLFKMTVEGPEVSDFIFRTVGDIVAFRQKHASAPGAAPAARCNDFIDLLLQLREHGHLDDAATSDAERKLAHEIKMTDKMLAAQVFIFYFAGFETTSTAISFAFYELALNPHVQERLREEVDRTLADNDGKLTYELINQMPYLDMVWSETLRKYPSINSLPRLTLKDYQIPGTDVVVPKGTWVEIPVLAIHRDPKYYPDPDKFIPERFTEEEKAKRNSFTYLPFGEGPRICIGMRFANVESKLIVATLISRYRFSRCPKTQDPIRYAPECIVAATADGSWVKIESR